MALEQQDWCFPLLWDLPTLLAGAAQRIQLGSPTSCFLPGGENPPSSSRGGSCGAAPSSSAELPALREG